MNGQGVIYKLKLMRDGTWKRTVIHALTGGDDGAGGSAGRLLLYKGSLYSVTTTGGANGKGVAYKITQINGVWKFTALYAFNGQPDAGLPYGTLALDSKVGLYVTTYYDGAHTLVSVSHLPCRLGGP